MIDLNLTYIESENGTLLPELSLPEQPEVCLGRLARMREKYLREEKKPLYISLLTQCKLPQHLSEVEQTARERIRQMSEQRAKAMGVDAALKQSDPLKWAGLMTNIRMTAEQEVVRDLILT